MKKLLVAVVFWGCWVGELRAQHFSNLYFDSRLYVTFGSIEEKDGNYYVTGMTAQTDTPHFFKGLFGKVHQSGALIFTQDIVAGLSHPYFLYWNNMKKTDDGNLLAVGEKWDSLYKVFLMKTDTQGNLLLLKEYSYPQVNIFHGQDVQEIPGEGYLIAINANFTNGNSEVIIIRTDTAGEVINQNVYSAGYEEWPWIICPMLNGHYMVGAFSMKGNNTTPFWCKTWLIEIDSMGNMVDQWLDSDTENKWPKSMQQTVDSGWIIVRQHLAYDVNSFQLFNASIVKLDKSFGTEWEHYLGDSSDVTSFYDVSILPDRKYVACGTTPVWGSDSAHRFGWIVKFDTNGTILWDRKYVAYERFGTHSFLYDIDVLPNGDLLACGELQFTNDVGITPLQQGWLLKVDSNGCVVDNCVVDIPDTKLTLEKMAIKLYPNPATDYVVVDYGFIDWSKGDVRLEMSDELGRVVYEQGLPRYSGFQKVDVAGFGSGVYVVSIKRNGVVVAGSKFGKTTTP